MKSDARLLAYKIIHQFNHNKRLDVILDDVFKSARPDNKTKSRAKVLVHEIIRLKGRLDLMIMHISGKT